MHRRFDSEFYSVRNPGPPPQSPNRSELAIPSLTGIGVALAAIILFSGIPARSLAGFQDPNPEVSTARESAMDSNSGGATPTEKQKPPAKPSESGDDNDGKPPAKNPVNGQAEKWILQLGSESWEQRESASAELKKLGEGAREALQRALKNPDLEVSSKAEEILSDLDKPTVEELVRKSAEAKGRLAGRRKITTGPRGELVVTLDLGPDKSDKSDKTSNEIEDVIKDLRKLEEDRLKEFFEGTSPLDTFREIEKQLARDTARSAPIHFPGGTFPGGTFPGGIFPGGGISWDRIPGSASSEQFSRNEYRNGKLSLSIQGKNGQYTVEPMGFVLERLHPALKSHLPLAKEAGLMVKSVRPQSPAESLGIKPWDILIKAGDQKISGEKELAENFRFPRSNKPLEVLREGRPLILNANPDDSSDLKKQD